MDKDKLKLFEAIYSHVETLGRFIDRYIPEGREKSLAITKLQECQMWADQAVAQCDDPVDVTIHAEALRMDEEELDA